MKARFAERLIRDAAQDTPVVVIQGPRQSGKTTLAQQFPGQFVTLDDEAAREAAARNPAAFLRGHSNCLIIDEVQRAPGLFIPLKAEVDKNRRPGMFLLTGSTDLLLLPKIADSLAGRLEVVPLWPMSAGEILEEPPMFLEWAFGDDFAWNLPAVALDWSLVSCGGYPEPVSRSSSARRAKWFEQYIDALITKDIRDLANIHNLALIPRLLRALARQTSQSINMNALSAEAGIQRTTTERYLDLLEAVFLWRPIQAWRPDADVRTARKPKVTFVDTGILGAIGAEVSPLAMLDSFVTMECLKQASWSDLGISVQTFRSAQSWSIPVLLQDRSGKLVALSVSEETAPPRESLGRMQFLMDLAGDKFHRGILLHAGTESGRITDRVGYAPISSLWLAKPT